VTSNYPNFSQFIKLDTEVTDRSEISWLVGDIDSKNLSAIEFFIIFTKFRRSIVTLISHYGISSEKLNKDIVSIFDGNLISLLKQKIMYLKKR